MTLQEIFATDPLSLTRPDREVIIAKFREDRANFMLGLKTPKEKKSPPAKISLSDLGI